MPGQRPYRTTADLPGRIAVFPLTGVLLLPRGHLPLNVFEPRYLAMVDDALAGSRMIGMIQPTESEEENLSPPLNAVGCAGRITSYRETEDGRYLITLTGICRYRIAEELRADTPFRQVAADYKPYAEDLMPVSEADFPRDRLLAALKDYLKQRELQADWRSIMGAPAENLVNALAMLCPFEPAEKQALLEAPGWPERVDTLVTLLEMTGAEPPGGGTMN